MKSNKSTSEFTSEFGDTSRKAQEFGVRLKCTREKLGLTQPLLAKKIGVSLTTVQNYEGGQLPKGEHAISLAQALGISLDELLLGISPSIFLSTQNGSECQQCSKLESELEHERADRRHLMAENRELSTENRQLWKENGDLRERCARLEGQGALDACLPFKKLPNTQPSDRANS